MGKSSSPPPAPDPYAVAGAQGKINQDTARLNATLNRPTINTPFGSQTWTQSGPQYDQNAFNAAQNNFNSQLQGGGLKGMLSGALRGAPRLEDFKLPGSDQWTSNITLAPGVQGLVDNYMQQASQPFSLTGAMDTLSSVTEPQYQKDEDALRTRLINTGFRQGSEGFDSALGDLRESREKGRAATALQAAQLAGGIREQPLREFGMLALPSGMSPANAAPADITSPFSQQYQGKLAGYNADVASQNAKLGGATTLGAAYLLSDRRLKSDIKRIGTHPLGIGVYEYTIFGRKDVGVMADEVEKVKPSAVIELHNGYKAVDYAQLG